MSDLLTVWNEIEKYIDNGISVVPVHDRGDRVKTPYGGSWKQFQEAIIGKDTLFDLMDGRYNTTAVGIIGGRVSGNLEIIDVDVKYKSGIDAVLFTDLKTLYPDIFIKLRIHKTPSGGYHIIYRCEEPVPGNMKLARRENEPGMKPKHLCFIETRGEGGYVVAPPALGYSVHRDLPIPVITKHERDSIIKLCQSYDEVIEIKTERVAKSTYVDYYEQNPFDDFNNRCDPVELAESCGWKRYRESNRFIWFTRPGKSRGVSMSFNLQTRFFYVFTASTELQEAEGYTPASILLILQHNGDTKALYKDLVARGYGKIKPKIEERIIKTSVINNNPLPGNVSASGLNLHAQISATLNKQHPYGIFWIDSEKNGIQIDREALYHVAGRLGFRLFKDRLIYSDGTYIEDVDERFFFDKVKAYIKEEDEALYKDICNAYEVFIERHGNFTITRLPLLDKSEILADTRDECYKIYQNGVLQITADGHEFIHTDKLIWRAAVQPRNFIPHDGGKYLDFISRAIGDPDDYLLSIIGFLAHEFKDETTGYIVVLTEECENPKDGGGAGKNVFSNLFKHITSFTSKPGEQVKYDEKFLQSWNYQKIYCLSDVPKSFNFQFLKELSTGTGLLKKLFKNETEVASEDMPKFLIQTNYSVEIKDGGLRRRVKIIEFTDFFTKAGGIDVHYNAHFPGDWTDADWNGFDTIIVKGVQTWLKAGRKIGMSVLSAGGWMKQFEQSHGVTVASFIKEHIGEWVNSGWVDNNRFKEQLQMFYAENNTPKIYQPSFNKINDAISDWCRHHDIQFINHMQRWEATLQKNMKCKWFGKKDDTPF